MATVTGLVLRINDGEAVGGDAGGSISPSHKILPDGEIHGHGIVRAAVVVGQVLRQRRLVDEPVAVVGEQIGGDAIGDSRMRRYFAPFNVTSPQVSSGVMVMSHGAANTCCKALGSHFTFHSAMGCFASP